MKRNQFVIYPAVLSKTWRDYQYKIKTAARYFKGVQVDAMDGKFVPQRTFCNFKKINTLKPKQLFFEIQLMVVDPFQKILQWSKVGDRYIIHIESTKNPKPIISLCRALGKEVGLAVNPKTEVNRVKPFLGMIDEVLIMTVEPGKSGQQFIPNVLDKVRLLRRWKKRLSIEVDGGIQDTNISEIVRAGANIIVSGSYLWKYGNIPMAKRNLLKGARVPLI